MAGGFREGEYVLGIEGLALLRAGASRDYAGVPARVAEISAAVHRLDDELYAARRDLPETAVDEGYTGWAPQYDEPGNDTIALEQPVVWGMLDGLPAGGPVLDAACGTGRHAARLAAAGREVIGVDSSEAMLARARERLPGADLRVGDVAALPLEDGSVAAAVCALALSHLPSLGAAVVELARVLRPGGRLVISNRIRSRRPCSAGAPSSWTATASGR